MLNDQRSNYRGRGTAGRPHNNQRLAPLLRVIAGASLISRLAEKFTQQPSERQLFENWMKATAALDDSCKRSQEDGRILLFQSDSEQLSEPPPLSQEWIDRFIRQLHKAMVEAAANPTILLYGTSGIGKSGATMLWALDHGPTLLLLLSPEEACVADCFFSRAAREAAADDLSGADCSIGTGSGRQTLAGGHLAKAVVQSFVERHAVFDKESAQFLLPQDISLLRPYPDLERVESMTFVKPANWGFDDSCEPGRWMGFPSSAEVRAHAAARFDSLRLADEQYVDRLLAVIAGTHANVSTKEETGPGRGIVVNMSPAGESCDWATRAAVPTRMPCRPRPWQADVPSRGEERGDPSCCREILLDVLRSLEEPQPAERAREALSFRLAVALGRCRLFGVDVRKDLDTTSTENHPLSPRRELLEPGLRELLRRLNRWLEESRNLADRLLETTPWHEMEICCGLLESRMDAWAAWIAIDEACLSQEDGTPLALPDSTASLIDQVLKVMIEFDSSLKEQESELALAGSTALLRNWRQLLAPFYRGGAWWLAGGIEAGLRCDDDEEDAPTTNR